MAKIFYSFFLFSFLVEASTLSNEIRALRNSLGRQDPARLELTLRLADELVAEVNKTVPPTEKSRESKKEAVRLYEEALTGDGGNYPGASPSQSVKITFQMAKLLSDLNEESRAMLLWEKLSKAQEYPHLKREALLRLAEYEGVQGKNLLRSLDLYSEVLKMCAGTDLCSYVHYRKAWALRELKKINEAISEMQEALYDSKGQVREEALKDLMTFFPLNVGKEEEALRLVEALAHKLSRPALIEALSQAFYSAGNRVWGTKILAWANTQKPTLQSQVKLLEEYYGLRDWEKFEVTLQEVERKPSLSSQDQSFQDPKEGEKILKRLCVQLDGERQSQKERAYFFQRVVRLYLDYFPNSSDRLKFMEGWIAAETSDQKQITSLTGWLQYPDLKKEERVSLLMFRAAAAEKTKETVLLEKDLNELIPLSSETQKRELSFRLAVLQYGKKELVKAETVLLSLTSQSDTWGNKGRCLLLQIWGEEKKYKEVVSEGEAWVKTFPQEKAFCPVNLAELVEHSRFEYTVSLGETNEALTAFEGFCRQKRFLPESCSNAKVLAVKLSARENLYQLLEQEKNYELLASELEAAGRFSDSARTIETHIGPKNTGIWLRTALLYELGQQPSRRDAILKNLQKELKTTKKIEQEEVLAQTYVDSGLVSDALLRLSWSDNSRAKIAYQMEVTGVGTALSKKILLDQPQEYRNSWSFLIVPELKKMDATQKKIHFYGKNSETRFNLRLAGIKKLSTFADRYLPLASQETRSEMAAIVRTSYQALADEVLATPIPEKLTEAQKNQIIESVKSVAEPFLQKSVAYQALQNKTSVVVAMDPKKPPIEYPKTPLEKLSKNPKDILALTELKNFYVQTEQPRLASYFEGRIQSVKEVLQ